MDRRFFTSLFLTCCMFFIVFGVFKIHELVLKIMTMPIKLFLQVIFWRKGDLMFISPNVDLVALLIFGLAILIIKYLRLDPYNKAERSEYRILTFVLLIVASFTLVKIVDLFFNYSIINEKGVYYHHYATKKTYQWSDVEGIELQCYKAHGSRGDIPVVKYWLYFTDKTAIDLYQSLQFKSKFRVIDKFMPNVSRYNSIKNNILYHNRFSDEERAYIDQRFNRYTYE